VEKKSLLVASRNRLPLTNTCADRKGIVTDNGNAKGVTSNDRNSKLSVVLNAAKNGKEVTVCINPSAGVLYLILTEEALPTTLNSILLVITFGYSF